MLNWLRELLGEPAPVHIHFDKGAVAVASPGDVVILRVTRAMEPRHRMRVVEEIAPWLEESAPGVKFIVTSEDLNVLVIANGEAAQ